MTQTQKMVTPATKSIMKGRALPVLGAVLAAQMTLVGCASAHALAGDGQTLLKTGGTAVVLAANDATPDTSPPALTASPPSGEVVIVKPMTPTTTPAVDPVSLTENTRQIMATFADELAGRAKTLEARQGEVALCVDAAKSNGAQGGDDVHGLGYFECLAKSVAETQADWTAMAGSFHHFADNLGGIATQVASLQDYVATRNKTITDESRQTQTLIATGRQKLLLVQAAVAHKQVLTPDQIRQTRILIDDVWAMYQRGKLLDSQKAVLDGATSKLTAYADYIAGLKGEAGVQEHIAMNRADTWSAMLRAVRDQSTISDLDQGIQNLDKGLQSLTPTLSAIRGLQGAELPQLPGGTATVTPSTDTLSAPDEDLGPLLDHVLGLTNQAGG
jgi:hypothetical protein